VCHVSAILRGRSTSGENLKKKIEEEKKKREIIPSFFKKKETKTQGWPLHVNLGGRWIESPVLLIFDVNGACGPTGGTRSKQTQL